MRLPAVGILLGMYAFLPSPIWAHGGHDHGHHHHHGHSHDGHHEDDDLPSNAPRKSAEEVNAALAKVAESYQKNVQPIFQQKCFDCHTTETKFPAYYGIPGIKHWINRDIEKGRKRLDMSKGFESVNYFV